MSQVNLAIGFGLVTASILALGAVGFTMQFAITNIFNLAYGNIMTIAAYAAYWVGQKHGINVWVALAAGGLVGAAISWAINRLIYVPFLRRGTSQFTMVMVSLAVGTILVNGIQIVAGVEFYTLPAAHTGSIHFLGMLFTARQLAIIAVAVVAMGLFHGLLRYTRIGKAMRATAADPELARSCGIATGRVTDVAWVVSGLLCGIAGVTLAMNTVVFDPSLGNSFLLVIVAAAVFGSAGQPYGAMIGALVIGVTSEIAAIYSPSLKQVVAFALLVLILLLRPEGLLGKSAATRAAIQ
jgi:branched-subunit amino acid ABC-type transport system permease component